MDAKRKRVTTGLVAHAHARREPFTFGFGTGDMWAFRVRGTTSRYGFPDVFENVKPGGLTDAGGSEAPR